MEKIILVDIVKSLGKYMHILEIDYSVVLFNLFENSLVCNQGRLILLLSFIFFKAVRNLRMRNYFLDIWVTLSSHCSFSHLSFLPLWVCALTLRQTLRLTEPPFHNVKKGNQRKRRRQSQPLLSPWVTNSECWVTSKHLHPTWRARMCIFP